MATIAQRKARSIERHRDEITELEQSVVDDSIAHYSSWREYDDDHSKMNWRRCLLYKRAWEASVAALLVKRAVLVYLEGGDDDEPTF